MMVMVSRLKVKLHFEIENINSSRFLARRAEWAVSLLRETSESLDCFLFLVLLMAANFPRRNYDSWQAVLKKYPFHSYSLALSPLPVAALIKAPETTSEDCRSESQLYHIPEYGCKVRVLAIEHAGAYMPLVFFSPFRFAN